MLHLHYTQASIQALHAFQNVRYGPFSQIWSHIRKGEMNVLTVKRDFGNSTRYVLHGVINFNLL